MYVSVKYERDGKWGTQEYTYYSKLNLFPGQAVIAPTVNNPNQLAIVSQTNLPKPNFKCREITEVWSAETGEIADV